MTRPFSRAALALVLALFAPLARAEELTLGVFLPSAGFVTNAERTAWAERLALALTSRANTLTVRTQVFARKEDAIAFADRVDLFVAEPLFALTREGTPIAQLGATPVALYALDPGLVGALAGREVAYADIGPSELNLYSQTALGGELAADRFFTPKAFKDASAALAAVKSRAVAAAFAPTGHPAADGLVVLAEGGRIPRAVVVLSPAKKALAPALRRAFSGLSADALGTFAEGAPDLDRVRALRSPPLVLTAPAVLTPAPRPAPPPIRLEARGKLPTLDLRSAPLATPVLEELP
jgi:hypothetical protein